MKNYDILIIGPVSLDYNIDCEGNERKELGGAVVASGFAAARGGARTAIFTKSSREDTDINNCFKDSCADIYWKQSVTTCSIRNQYLTADKEKRICTSLSVCDGFKLEELPKVKALVYQFAGLVYGDFDGELFSEASNLGKVAVDAQCLLRYVEKDGSMQFKDWKDKFKYMPYIDFLKTDAAEAEILTGLSNRREAAKMLYSFGAKEIIITHNTEVLVYDGSEIYTCPIRARNLSGRTGRGDTVFAAYLTERLKSDIKTSLLYSAALVSLKMEKPGPFRENRDDVLEYIREFYTDF